jgi:hypothetical protein
MWSLEMIKHLNAKKNPNPPKKEQEDKKKKPQ